MAPLFTMAWRNMWRNWRRTAIAMIAIVLGLILLLFFDGMIQGSDQAIFGNAVRLYGGNLQIHAVGFRDKANRLPLLPLDDPDAVVETVRSLPTVAAAGLSTATESPQVVATLKRIQIGGLISNHEGTYPISITAVEPEAEAPFSIQAENIAEGRYLVSGDEDAVVLGRGLADMLKVNAGDRLTLIGRRKNETMRQRTMTVVGIYDLGMADAEKSSVFITLPEAQSLYNLRGQVTEVSVVLSEVGKENTLMSALQAALPGYEVDSWKTLRPEMQETIEMKATFTSIFGLIVLLIASIGILNLMLMAVFERTREMGVLAALGMKGRQIMALFLIEGMLIGVVGAITGCALGLGLIWGVAQVGIDISFTSGMGEITALMGDRLYPYVTTAGAINRGIAVAVIAGLASIYPAWQASRKEPAAALHHV
jgi:ABC-type lipoprotein release transport system permease subunit